MKEINQNFTSKQTFQEGMPPAPDAGIFGLTTSYEQSQLVILPVTWDATASYGKGTAFGPDGILKASHQLDLEDLRFGKAYENGILLLESSKEIARLNTQAGALVNTIRNDNLASNELQCHLGKVNDISSRVNTIVEQSSKMHLENGKFVAVLGGDHSSPLGLIKSLAENHADFGILHIDAHFDLRKAYEGFKYSHASVMYNALNQIPQLSSLVQVGIRDFCSFESKEAIRCSDRVKVFYDSEIFAKKAEGYSFKAIADDIVAQLPSRVYISFDIDGLDPSNCPGTGTPVPGGVSFHEASYLLEVLANSGKKIIGFDLCEVASQNKESEWDYNVGARILYKLCGALFHSVYAT